MVRWHGLGFLLQTGRDFNDVAQVVAVMVVMVAMGMICDRLVFAPLRRTFFGRRFRFAVSAGSRLPHGWITFLWASGTPVFEGYGLCVVEEVPLKIEPSEHNAKYLQTKKAKLGHKL